MTTMQHSRGASITFSRRAAAGAIALPPHGARSTNADQPSPAAASSSSHSVEPPSCTSSDRRLHNRRHVLTGVLTLPPAWLCTSARTSAQAAPAPAMDATAMEFYAQWPYAGPRDILPYVREHARQVRRWGRAGVVAVGCSGRRHLLAVGRPHAARTDPSPIPAATAAASAAALRLHVQPAGRCSIGAGRH